MCTNVRHLLGDVQVHQMQIDEVVKQVAVAKQIVQQMQIDVVVKQVRNWHQVPSGEIGKIADVRVCGLFFFISFKA